MEKQAIEKHSFETLEAVLKNSLKVGGFKSTLIIWTVKLIYHVFINPYIKRELIKNQAEKKEKALNEFNEVIKSSGSADELIANIRKRAELLNAKNS